MKQLTLILTLVICSFAAMAQHDGGGRHHRPLTEQEITQMVQRRAEMVKKQLNLSAEQEATFDKEYYNYNNIILATRTKQFKNRVEPGSSVEETVAKINDEIDCQLTELVAKKQLINNLKNVLSAEQLAKLNMLTNDGLGRPGGKRVHDPGHGDGAPRHNGGNTSGEQ